MARREPTVNLPTIDQIVPPDARAAVLQRLALLQIGRIKRRTSAGLDVNGAAFRAYSPRYREQRRRAGWGTKPDLWLKGGMLGSLGLLEVTPARVLIGFQGSAAGSTFRARARAKRHRKTGERLALTVVETSKRVPNALKAAWNDRGEGTVPRRHFFGVSAEDRAFLMREALRELLAIAGRTNVRRTRR